MQDEYWQSSITRIAPEAPIPVIRVLSTETRPGGASNVANSIEAMGVQVERIFGSSERIRKIRLRAANQYVARVDFDHPQTPIEPDANYRDALTRCDIVVFVDYGKGALQNVAALISAAAGKTILVDPKGHDYSKYRGATMIKPNRDEMRELVGPWTSQDELDFKARQFLLASGIESILLTQGAEGMTLYTRADTLHVAAFNKAPVDVSGAGEAALSAYAAALAKREPLAICLHLASKAAAIAISHHGTYVVREEELWS